MRKFLDWLFGCREFISSEKVGVAWRNICIPATPTLAGVIACVEVKVSIDADGRKRLPFFRTLTVCTHARLLDSVPQPAPFGGVAAMTQWWEDVDPAELLSGEINISDIARRAADSLRDSIVANR